MNVGVLVMSPEIIEKDNNVIILITGILFSIITIWYNPNIPQNFKPTLILAIFVVLIYLHILLKLEKIKK